MITPLLVLYWSVILTLTCVFTGVSGLALYAAIWSQLTEETGWTGRLLFHYGRALIVFVVLVATLGVVASLVTVAVVLVQTAARLPG